MIHTTQTFVRVKSWSKTNVIGRNHVLYSRKLHTPLSAVGTSRGRDWHELVEAPLLPWTIRDVKQAIELHIESLRENGEPIPAPHSSWRRSPSRPQGRLTRRCSRRRPFAAALRSSSQFGYSAV